MSDMQKEFKKAFDNIMSDIKDGMDMGTGSKSEKEPSNFKKNDEGKLQWSLMPFEQLEDVVRVLMNGAKKYSPGNWKKCDDPTRYTDALMRHVTAYVEGQKFDTGPGGDMIHHLAHAICDCLFIMYFEKGEITAWKNWLMEQENNLK